MEKKNQKKHLLFLSVNNFEFKGVPTTSGQRNLHLCYYKLKPLKCHTIAINRFFPQQKMQKCSPSLCTVTCE